jgi:hypothetical protein
MPHHVLITDSGKLVPNFKTTEHRGQKLKWEENILTKTANKGKESSLKINYFQPSDAMWHHTFHLSLICTSFAQ